jgi:NADPH-dependent 2,4-dienoyl-CoA reductase/sulfur reductase-like enzyme
MTYDSERASRTIDEVVIVGGGVAAQRAAFALRELGYGRAITLLTREATAPYDRTLLSKSMIVGRSQDPMPLRPASSYAEHEIDVRLCTEARALDASRSEVVCADGSRVAYDRLVLATGAAAVRPRVFDIPGVHTLRELADLAPLLDALEHARRLVIVGAGFIGGELASSARALGLDVAVVEAAPAPLALALGEEVGRRVAELQLANGVDLHVGVPVSSIVSRSGSWRVALADGRELAADVVVLALGMLPRTDWLQGSGLRLEGGIQTDLHCRTNLPGVFAAGDCVRWHSLRYGVPMHVGHWDVAAKHGEAVAANAVGEPVVFDPVPFFWSDQHGRKLAMAGATVRWDEVQIEEGDEAGAFTATYRARDGERIALFSTRDLRCVARAHRELAEVETRPEAHSHDKEHERV